MPKYEAAMTALGLSRGDTFESDEPEWGKYVDGGVLKIVGDETPLTVVPDPDENEDLDGE